MKKTLAIVLAVLCALTLSLVALAEGMDASESAVEETVPTDDVAVEVVEEPVEEPAEEPAEEPVEEPVETENRESAESDFVSEEGFAAYREQRLANADYPYTEADLWFGYLWGDMKQYWVETPEGSVMTFDNPSPEDITLSLRYESHEYKSPDEYTDEDWAVAADPNRTPPYNVIGTYDVTLVVPAGDTAGVLIPIDLGCGGYMTISRGGFTVDLTD